MKPTNPSQTPEDLQFQLGATSDEAAMTRQLINSPIGPPGDIIARLGQQFQLPRAEPDANMSDRPGINVGES